MSFGPKSRPRDADPVVLDPAGRLVFVTAYLRADPDPPVRRLLQVEVVHV
jgi:hypothetical protein